MIAQGDSHLANDPLREVDWRWRLAGALSVSRCRLAAGSYDDLTLRAARFRRDQLAGLRTSRDAALEAAQQLSKTYDDDRLQIEAKLLAGSSVREVARCLRESTDVVSAFAGLFFDVESCLDHEDYIHCRVLQTPAQKRSTAERLRSSVHRLSYLGGPLVVEAALTYLPALKQAIAGKYDFSSRPLSLEKRLAVLATALTASLTLPEMLQLTEKCPENDLQPNTAYEGPFAGELNDRLDQLLADGGWETPVNEVWSGIEGNRQQVG